MLRCGVVLDSLKPDAWVVRILNGVLQEGLAGVVLVLLDEAAAEGQGGSRLFRWYEQWDYRRNRAEQDALAPTDVTPSLPSVPIVRLERSGDPGERAMEQILAANLDLVLDLGTRALHRKIDTPPRGVWRVRNDLDFRENDGSLSAWDALEHSTATESVVEFRHRESAGAAAASRSFATVETMSLYRSRNPVYWKGAEMFLRSLRAMAAEGAAVTAEPSTSIPKYRQPTEWETALYLVRYAGRWALRRGTQPACKWHIAIRRRSDGRRFDDPAAYSVMPCPEDRFYADPFLFERDGRTYLFFEDFPYDLQRGVISCCELDEEGRPGEPFEVLRRSYHLSYPAMIS